MDKLLPCPFCGGEAKLADAMVYMTKAKMVKCLRCGAKSKMELIDHPQMSFDANGAFLDESTRYTEEQAAKRVADAWNRRVDQKGAEECGKD